MLAIRLCGRFTENRDHRHLERHSRREVLRVGVDVVVDVGLGVAAGAGAGAGGWVARGCMVMVVY